MEEFLRKATVTNLISTGVFLILGIILAMSPVAILAVITYFIEALLIVWGTVTIVTYVRIESKYDVFSLGFVQGVVCILLAIFLIVNPKIIATILPICIGICMIVGSLTRIQIAIKLSEWGQKTRIFHIILAIVMFSLGLAILCNPFATATLLLKMLGGGIIVYSVLDILQCLGIIVFLNKYHV